MNEETNIPNNTEIEKALKQFETESQAGQPQKSSEVSKVSPVPQKDVEGVKFEIPSYGAVKYYQETDTPKMVKLVIKWSGVKEQKQAEWILLGFVIVAIAVSLFLVFGGRIKTKIEAPPGYKIIYPPNAPPRLEQPIQ